ncbi:hypothetical protein GJ496_005844 [Pomphorhynchus laevis]|nr:hypothetical protein GJ496_005844 [Pomphorhynchus laevis]
MSRFSKQIQCDKHPDAQLIEDYRAGDMICSKCGLVVGDRMVDVCSEWRTFSSDKDSKDMSRVGAAENPLLNGEDLSTYVGRANGEASYDQFGNLKYKNRKAVSAMERTLNTGFREIHLMSERLNLPQSVKQQAEVLFKKVYDTRALRGRSQDAVIAASVYIACRRENATRTFKEICAVSRSSKKDIGRCFKQILKCLEESVELIKTDDFMSRFCSHLSISMDVQKMAIHVANRAIDSGMIAGRAPISIAAAAIYLSCNAFGDRRNAKDIGDVAGVADSTIRQVYKMMLTKAHDLYPQNFKGTVTAANLPPG